MGALLAYFFYGLIHNISSGCDLFLLTDSVHAVECLVLYHGIPLRLHEENVVCGGQVQSKGISNNFVFSEQYPC